jgi:hypothetical protein
MSVIINGSAGVTTNSGAVYDSLQRGTAVTASGTSVDFTGIPSWVRRITVMFQGVSTNGTSNLLIQIGSGSVTTTGYVSVASRAIGGTNETTSTAGFNMNGNAATNVISGAMTLLLFSGNTWVSSHTAGSSANSTTFFGGGQVTLSGVLDRLRVTTVNGTDTFDAGSINILYE